jgi:hypothetical protein
VQRRGGLITESAFKETIMRVHNVKPLKPRRKELRAAMKPAEIRLWQALK